MFIHNSPELETTRMSFNECAIRQTSPSVPGNTTQQRRSVYSWCTDNLARVSSELHWVTTANPRRLRTWWFHLCKFLEMEKLWKREQINGRDAGGRSSMRALCWWEHSVCRWWQHHRLGCDIVLYIRFRKTFPLEETGQKAQGISLCHNWISTVISKSNV